MKHLTECYVFPTLYKRVKSCLNTKNFNFLPILNSKVILFYYIMADTWCHWNMIIWDLHSALIWVELLEFKRKGAQAYNHWLNNWHRLLLLLGCCYWKKRLNSVNAKVSYLCAGILNDKSAISLVIAIFEK